MTAEVFIKDCTRGCSNVLYYHNQNYTHGTDYAEDSGIEVTYSSWLTPEQALKAVELAREQTINKACEWLETTNLDYYQIREGVFSKDLITDFRKYMEEE